MGELKPTVLEEWLSILDLSCRWAFDGIRNLAIKGAILSITLARAFSNVLLAEIEKLDTDPVDRIVISRKYDVKPEWLLPAYTALCERREPLSYPEAGRIGDLDTIVRLAQARETIQRAMWNGELSILAPVRTGNRTTSFWMPPGVPSSMLLTAEDSVDISTLEPSERLARAHLLTVAKFFNIRPPKIQQEPRPSSMHALAPT